MFKKTLQKFPVKEPRALASCTLRAIIRGWETPGLVSGDIKLGLIKDAIQLYQRFV